MKISIKPTRIKATLALLGLTFLSAVSSQAIDRFWTAGTATWNSAGNWTPSGVPNNDNAIVNNGGTVVISAGDPTWTPFDIRAGDGGANTGYYIQDGGTVTLNSWFRISIGSGSGSYNMNGGTLTTFRFIIGDGGGVGVFNQTNGTVNVNNDEVWLGQNGATGTYNMSGGTLNYNSWFALGRNGSGTGTINLTNGAINKTGGGGTFIVGANAIGVVNQYGGTVSNTVSESWIAEGSGTGTWNLLGGTAILGTLNCAQGGTATLNLGGSGVLAASEIKPNGGSGTINFNGGTLQARASTVNLLHDIASVVVNSDAKLDTAGFNVTVAQTLTDGGSGGGFVKSGAGTAKLTGANNYTGSTIVKAGKLQISTATAVSSSVVVSNGAGYGVLVGVANGQVSSANATLGSSAATSLDFDLGNFGNPTLAPINVTGNLAVNGTVSVNIADALPQVGQFPLVKYVTKSGSGSFAVGTLPAGVSATISNNIANSSIDLVISSTALIRWDGQVAGSVWDINTTTNWTDYVTLGAAKFTTGSAVFFDDLALGATTVNLGVTVNPGTVVFTNDTLAYIIQGNGAIGGTSSLTKQGTNTTSITTTNTYTGVTTVSGGTLSVNRLANGGSPSSIGSSSSSSSSVQLNGGTLSYSGPAVSIDRGYSLIGGNNGLATANDLTLSGSITTVGSANVTKSGAGTVTYRNQSANSLASGGNYVILNGAVVLDNSTNSIAGELWSGGTVAGTGGALVVSNSTLNISSWFSIARGTGTGGYASSATFNNAKVSSGNMSMCYDNGVPATLQSGALTLNGSSTYTNIGDVNMGESSGGTATITLNDSSVFYSGGRIQFGWHNGATGVVTVANSAKIVVNAWMSIGNEGGVGSVLVKDNGSINLVGGGSDLNICDVNTGTADLTLTNNGKAVCNALFVGKGAGSTGTLNVWQNATVVGKNGGGSYVEIGSQAGAIGTLNLNNGGTLSARRIRSVNGGSGTLNIDGGVLKAAADGGDAVDADFLNNLTAANIGAGGATLDTVTNTANVTQAIGGTGSLTKVGTGTLLLNGVNTYSGSTLITAGTLGGSGTIAGPLVVQSGATLSPGASIATLTASSTVSLAAGSTTVMEVNKTALTSDTVAGSTTVTFGGTLILKNLSGALQPGDTFTLFTAGAYAGSFSSVVSQTPGQTVTWNTSQLAPGGNGTVSVTSAVTTPATITAVPSGGNLNLSWPANQIGYQLQTQVNPLSVGISTNWVAVPGSTGVTALSFPVSTAQPSVFYRLVFPAQ